MSDQRMDHHFFERRLFEAHSREQLRDWARRLKYFRFCRAFGGHSGDDGDQLVVAIRAESEPDLLEVLGVLGIRAEQVPPDAPQPQPGVAYTGTEWQAFPSVIPEFPHLKQPGHVRLAGQKAFAWASGGRFTISIADEHEVYDVTEAAVRAAQSVEPLLEPLALRIIDPPRDTPLCVSPEFYPEFWSGHS